MARADDIAPLLVPPADSGFGFHSGQVISWNPDTGSNVVRVAGQDLVDLPILNSGEAVALKAGHVVVVLRFQHTYFILGRVTSPGGSDFASASVDFRAGRDEQIGFAVTTTIPGGVKASTTLTVPPWADQALVFAMADGTLQNPVATTDIASLHARVAGLAGQENAVGISQSQTLGLAASMTRVLTNPGATITVEAGIRTQIGNWPTNAAQRCCINAFAVYRSTV